MVLYLDVKYQQQSTIEVQKVKLHRAFGLQKYLLELSCRGFIEEHNKVVWYYYPVFWSILRPS